MLVALAASWSSLSVPAAHANEHVAFQANTGNLWYWSSDSHTGYQHGAGHDLHLGMMKGTSPSITDDGFIASYLHIAFQADTGHLWEYIGWSCSTCSAGAGWDRHLGMMAGTSPSVAATASDETIPFQANTGNLWDYTSSSAAGSDLGRRLMKGTSPSIDQQYPDGDIAYQATDGDLWTTHHGNTGLAMKAGTSPSITSTTSTVAFQGRNGHLWIWHDSRGHDLGLAMMAGTSPSIISLTSGPVNAVRNKNEIAFQGANGDLWTWRGLQDGSETYAVNDTGLGMMTRTSPSMAANSDIAFQANTGHLWITSFDGNPRDLHLGMMAGTSPSIVSNPGA